MAKLQSRTVWHGRSWQLRTIQTRLPDGHILERGFIHHPGAVVLVPLRQTPAGPEVLMLHQYRFALQQTILELPAGTREEGEEWLVCAQRELREETGYRAATFSSLGEIWPAPGVSNELMQLYLAEELEPDPLPGDADEEINVAPMPLADLLDMSQNGRIHDAKTIIGLWWTANYFQRLNRA